MKKVITSVFACLFIIASSIQAQNKGTGLIFNDETYAALPKMPTFFGSKFAESQRFYSLKEFCPHPNNQGLAGSCVGQSVGYGAMSILNAKQNGWTDKNQITAEAYSALYIYNQIMVGSCEQGSAFQDAFEVMLTKGNIKFKDFEGGSKANLANCKLKPESLVSHTVIKDYIRLFDLDAEKSEKIGKIRKVIASGSPVVLGMVITTAIYNVDKNNIVYKPSQFTEGGHAMVVVGYDDRDQTFELFNSWGPTFGDQGFFKVKYDDLAKYVKYAYYINLKEAPKEEVDVIVEEEKETIALNGQFGFKHLIGDMWDDSLKFKTLATKKVDNHYELDSKDFAIGSHFRFEAYNMDAGKYVYVFSVDSERKPYIHWPRKEELNAKYFGFNETSLVPVKEASIVIPPEDEALLTKDKAGADYLFTLYSSEPIEDEDLLKSLQDIQNGKGEILADFDAAFSAQLMPWSDIKLKPNDMWLRAKSQKGTMAPIILKVEGN